MQQEAFVYPGYCRAGEGLAAGDSGTEEHGREGAAGLAQHGEKDPGVSALHMSILAQVHCLCPILA